MGPSLTVGITSYNHAHFLPELLDSLLTQSYAPVEVLVIDDASTDDTLEVAQAYARRQPLIRVIRNDRNLGTIANQNRIIEMARGDYLFMPGSDDKLQPGLLEKSMFLLARHPDAGFCSCLSFTTDEDGKRRGLVIPDFIGAPEPRFISADEARRRLYDHSSWITANTVIHRVAALRQLGGLAPELGPLADGFIAEVLAVKHGACYIPEPLALYRVVTSGYSGVAGRNAELTAQAYEAAFHLMRTRFGDFFSEKYIRRFRRRTTGRGMTDFSHRMRDEWVAGLRRLVQSDPSVPQLTADLLSLPVRLASLAVALLVALLHWRQHALFVLRSSVQAPFARRASRASEEPQGGEFPPRAAVTDVSADG